MSTKVWRYSEPSTNHEGWWSGQRIGLREFLLTVGRERERLEELEGLS